MSQPQVRCRQIKETDLEGLADLLTEGFPGRPRNYWASGLERLRLRRAPDGCPKFGYMLEVDGAPAGVVLLIATEMGGRIRCNVSSWYVKPECRGYAAPLITSALKLKHVTYLNISPAPATWPILKAQGYDCYSSGQFAALPALSSPQRHDRVIRVTGGERGPVRMLPEFDLMVAHAAAGCLALACETDAGVQPFIFRRRRLRHLPLATMQLIYCRDTEAFVRCAGALGGYLLGQGAPVVICDANGPIPGLAGHYFDGKSPKYFRGPARPRLNDLAFTETVVFGP